MHATPTHRILAADVHQVPRPFKALAVRSEEALHGTEARAVHGRVHATVHGACLGAVQEIGRAHV